MLQLQFGFVYLLNFGFSFFCVCCFPWWLLCIQLNYFWNIINNIRLFWGGFPCLVFEMVFCLFSFAIIFKHIHFQYIFFNIYKYDLTKIVVCILCNLFVVVTVLCGYICSINIGFDWFGKTHIIKCSYNKSLIAWW